MPKEAGALLGLKVRLGSEKTYTHGVMVISVRCDGLENLSVSLPAGGGRQNNGVREVRCLHHQSEEGQPG